MNDVNLMSSNSRESIKILKSVLKLSVIDVALMSRLISMNIEIYKDYFNDQVTEVICGNATIFKITSVGQLDGNFNPFSRYHRNMFSVTIYDGSSIEECSATMIVIDNGRSRRIIYNGKNGDRNTISTLDRINDNWYSGNCVVTEMNGDQLEVVDDCYKIIDIIDMNDDIIRIGGHYSVPGMSLTDSHNTDCFLDINMVPIEPYGNAFSDNMKEALKIVASRHAY